MSGYKSKENEITISEISISTWFVFFFFCSIIYNNYNMEITGMFVNGLMKKMKM